MNLTEKIKFLCNRKNVTIRKVEKECGFGNATICRWDAHEPSVSKVKKVADYFGMTIDDLIAMDELIGD